MHISLTWDGASGRSSFWDGTVLTPFCSSSRSSLPVVDAGRAADVIAVPVTRVLDTRLGVSFVASSGYGFDGGFRHGSHDGDWNDNPWPDSPPIDTGHTVTAEVQPAAPAVPAPAVPCRVGVAAVAVTVRALGSTAPATVRVWGPGQAARQVVTSVRMNGHAHGSAIVPVASDGTIALITSAGATDVTVDVTGYYLAGDQPNWTDVG